MSRLPELALELGVMAVDDIVTVHCHHVVVDGILGGPHGRVRALARDQHQAAPVALDVECEVSVACAARLIVPVADVVSVRDRIS